MSQKYKTVGIISSYTKNHLGQKWIQINSTADYNVKIENQPWNVFVEATDNPKAEMNAIRLSKDLEISVPEGLSDIILVAIQMRCAVEIEVQIDDQTVQLVKITLKGD